MHGQLRRDAVTDIRPDLSVLHMLMCSAADVRSCHRERPCGCYRSLFEGTRYEVFRHLPRRSGRLRSRGGGGRGPLARRRAGSPRCPACSVLGSGAPFGGPSLRVPPDSSCRCIDVVSCVSPPAPLPVDLGCPDQQSNKQSNNWDQEEQQVEHHKPPREVCSQHAA